MVLLYITAQNAHESVTKLLIEVHCNVNLLTKDGTTPYQPVTNNESRTRASSGDVTECYLEVVLCEECKLEEAILRSYAVKLTGLAFDRTRRRTHNCRWSVI